MISSTVLIGGRRISEVDAGALVLSSLAE